MASNPKKPRNSLEDNVEELEYYQSSIRKFYMDQHVCRFIIRNAGEYPEADLMQVFEMLIDRAYENSKKEGRTPKMFGMLINGEGLDSPICIPSRSREQNDVDVIMNEIDMLEIR
jgi:hypothetical protein